MTEALDACGVVYEVNLAVDQAVASRFSDWLRTHIVEMLALDGFIRAAWYEVEGAAAEDRLAWCVRYEVRDRAVLQRYFDVDAPRMRGDGLKRFSGRFEATRRILHRHAHSVADRASAEP